MFRRMLVGAVLAAGLTLPARAAEVDPLLPAETESVMFVNVRQVLDSDLVKKYAKAQIEQALKARDNQKILESLGLDPFKDIDRITMGSWGKGAEDMEAVVVIRGKFDPEKLFAAAQQLAGKENEKAKIDIVTEGKYKLVKITAENQPKPMFAAVADEKTIVGANDKKRVTELLARAEKGVTKAELKRDLALLVLRQDEKASLFACGLTEGKIEQIPGLNNIPGVDPEKFQKSIEKMQSFAMTLRLTDEVGLEMAMGMKDADAAEDFGDQMAQLIGTVKQFIPLVIMNQPNLKPVADELSKTLKASVKSKDVLISVKLSADAIGKATGGGD